ncbi:MAG: hypothetical protein EBT04_14965, partial [Betaproteobacteria bacterium]|nr:hypothetical protein [Betaproteobacteria bacterium]
MIQADAFSPLAQASSSVLSDMPARAVESAGASLKDLNVSTPMLVGAGAVLVGLAAGGGGGGSSAPRNQTGVVQDGLVKDATVFIDVNKNGVLDTGEPSAKTDAKGTFTIASDASGPIVATGGINIDTGSANTIILKAQPGSTVINPITTLVSALVVEQSLTLAAAETAVKSALGLDSKLNLSTYDPFAGTGDVAYQKVAASVALLASTVATAGSGGGAATFSALATTIKQSSATLDLTKAATLTTVFASVPAIATQSADLAQKNTAIATASNVADIPQKLLDYGVSQLTLSLKVDSGIANDRITNNGSVVLKDLTGAVANPTGLQYSIDGGKSFKADLATFAAAEGSNSLVLRLVADNGLASKTSAPLTFTLDTQLSVPTVGIASGSVGGVLNDSGLSSTDGITNVANPVLAGSAEAGSAIEILLAGVTVKTTADSAGRWTATLPSATRLADGTPDVTVTITDVAGNVKTSTAKASFTIDTKVPAAGTGGLTATAINDTGTSSTDGITANNRPQLSGTAEAGSTVTIDVG